METTFTSYGMQVTIPCIDGDFIWKLNQDFALNYPMNGDVRLKRKLQNEEQNLTDEFFNLAEKMNQALIEYYTPDEWEAVEDWERKTSESFEEHFIVKLDELAFRINQLPHTIANPGSTF